jgi:hypothetical protein
MLLSKTPVDFGQHFEKIISVSSHVIFYEKNFFLFFKLKCSEIDNFWQKMMNFEKNGKFWMKKMGNYRHFL